MLVIVCFQFTHSWVVIVYMAIYPYRKDITEEYQQLNIMMIHLSASVRLEEIMLCDEKESLEEDLV